MEISVRGMQPDDWNAVTRIYAEGIATNKATFERGKDNVSEAPDFVGNKSDVVFSLVETAGSSYFSIDGATGKISMSAASISCP